MQRYNNPRTWINNLCALYSISYVLDDNPRARFINSCTRNNNPWARYNNPCAQNNNPFARYNNPSTALSYFDLLLAIRLYRLGVLGFSVVFVPEFIFES